MSGGLLRDSVAVERLPDYLTSLSINTTRGRAMHSVFQYARWVRLCTDAQRANAGDPSISLDAMPEVQEVLDTHLDIGREPTRTIRSVFGDHLTLLAWLDWNWLDANLGRILPLADAEYAFFKAAWRSFVVFKNPQRAAAVQGNQESPLRQLFAFGSGAASVSVFATDPCPPSARFATWTPGTDIFAATAEGAGRDLGAAVIAKLDDFVAAAGDFRRSMSWRILSG